MVSNLKIVPIVLCASLAWAVGGVAQDSAQNPSASASPAAQAKPLAAASGTEIGNGIFEQKCVACHEHPATGSRAPSFATMKLMTPEKIYEALTTGPMAVVVGNTLTDTEKRRVAEAVTGRLIGSTGAGDAKPMPNHCASNPPMADPAPEAGWNGWGAGPGNTRFQTAKAAGLTAANVPHLKLKWAFGFPMGLSTYGQPTIVSGRVFIASDNGYVYSLSADTGCVYWSFQAKAAMRTAISVGPIAGAAKATYAAYFGDQKANVYAIDAQTGKQIWTRLVDNHVTARDPGAPTLADGKLFVPVSTFEEFSASDPLYPCCTFQGSVVALDANTGKLLWKTYTIDEKPKPVRKNSQGTQLWAPSGGSVWNSPTFDRKRDALYFGTGDGQTEPAPETTDAVMALDARSGKRLWFHQGTAHDSFLGGCDNGVANRPDNCPPHQGPDYDFGSSAMLRTLPNGRRLLVAGQKSGTVFAFDPDQNGALVWSTSVLLPGQKPPDSLGEIVYGGAIDDQNAYFALRSGRMIALALDTGKQVWAMALNAGGAVAHSAAVTGIPGAVFTGGWDGQLQALSTSDGHVLWQFDTARDFKTVNGVKAKGGAMGSAGATVADGMVFVGSGYAVFSGDQAGNVLLAFSAK
jgi:polyvinyl alcohol dehydrogenase (cytochrome)